MRGGVGAQAGSGARDGRRSLRRRSSIGRTRTGRDALRGADCRDADDLAPSGGVRTLGRGRRGLRGLGLRKMYLSVPAFAAPLTPVLNPLVGRAQWEIVVRSAAMAAVVVMRSRWTSARQAL